MVVRETLGRYQGGLLIDHWTISNLMMMYC